MKVMKNLIKKIAIATVAFTFTISATAQDSAAPEFYKHEVGVSYGALTNTDVISGFASIFGEVFRAVLGSSEEVESHYIGSFNAEYYYNFNKTIGLGGIVGFENIGYDYNDKTTKVTNLKENDYYISIMPAFKAHWFNFPHVSMYSKVGVGLTIDHTTYNIKDGRDPSNYSNETNCMFAFQVSPVCVEAGARHLMGFVELGYGTQGMFVFGLRGKF